MNYTAYDTHPILFIFVICAFLFPLILAAWDKWGHGLMNNRISKEKQRVMVLVSVSYGRHVPLTKMFPRHKEGELL